jgi:hypothetical protein
MPVVIENDGVALKVTGRMVSALCIALQTPRKVFAPVQMFVSEISDDDAIDAVTPLDVAKGCMAVAIEEETEEVVAKGCMAVTIEEEAEEVVTLYTRE